MLEPLGRPSGVVVVEQLRLARWGQRLQHAGAGRLQQERDRLARSAERLPTALQRALQAQQQRLERAELRLGLLDPRLVLERGYAWLQDASGRPVTRARQAQAGQALAATLADGTVEMTVTGRSLR